MLDITQQKGLITEILCMSDLTALGFNVLTPLADSSKYDIVAENNGIFYRIQCKHSTWCSDTKEKQVAFYINTCCLTTNTKETIRHKYSKNEIDYFYTNFNGQGYLVSIEEATGNTFRWRYEYPNNGQKSNIHIADNYRIEEVVKSW